MKAKSLLIITLLMMFSFSSFAVTDAECKARPLLRGNALIEQYVTGPYGGIDIGYYGVYNGCVYVGGINSNSDGSQSMSWFPQYSFIPGESKPGKKPPIETEKPTETKPNNPDSETVSDGEGTGTGTGPGAEGAGSGNEEGNHPSEPVSEPNSKPEPELKPQTDTEPEPLIEPVTPLVEPLPSGSPTDILDNRNLHELVVDYEKCDNSAYWLNGGAYNSAIVPCNLLVDKISAALSTNKIYSFSDKEVPDDFLIKTNTGNIVHCRENMDKTRYIASGFYVSRRNPVDLTPQEHTYLNMPYFTPDYSSDKICSSILSDMTADYFERLNSETINSSSSNSGVINDSSPPNSVTMAGNVVLNTGKGNSNVEDNDGDGILNELRNFHHDFNASQGRAQKTDNKDVVDAINKNGKASVDNSDKNNQELIDTLNKNHQEVIESLNKDNQIDERSLNNAFDDGYSHYENGATSAIDGIINALDKYSPNLKGFGLPDGFYSGKGHCVPLDLSFNVDLSYFHYSSPVNLSTGKMCEFYDGYPRELLKLLIYILTAFVLFRLVKKALE